MSPGQLPRGTTVHIPSLGCEPPPDIATLAIKFISACSMIDTTRAIAATRMMRAEHKAVRAMLDAMQSMRTRELLAEVAIRAVLAEEDHLFCDALANFIKPMWRMRNKLAHHIWARSKDIEDRILLVDPSELMGRELAGAVVAENFRRALAEYVKLPDRGGDVSQMRIAHLCHASHVEAITRKELEHELSKVESALSAFGFLECLLEPELADHARRRLSSLLQNELRPLRRSTQSNPESPAQPR